MNCDYDLVFPNGAILRMKNADAPLTLGQQISLKNCEVTFTATKGSSSVKEISENTEKIFEVTKIIRRILETDDDRVFACTAPSVFLKEIRE